MSLNNSSASGKLEHLDVLRGIAILLVFGYHWHLREQREYVKFEGWVLSFEGVTWEQLYSTFSPLNYGSSGVQLFLVISGFLIHYNYLRKGAGKLDIKKFYARRFWRIYPPYLLILLFYAFYNKEQTIYHLLNPEGRLVLGSHMLMIHNLFGHNQVMFGINPSFWSIALEVQLYLIYPLFLVLAGRLGIRKFCIVLMAVHIAALAGLMYMKGGMPDKLSEVTFVLHYWIVWALGALVADAYHHGRRIFSVSWTGWFLLMLLFILSQTFIVFFVYFCGIMVAVLWAILLELYIYKPLPESPGAAYIRQGIINIGLCSYSFYLIHQPALAWLLKWINWGGSSRFTDGINGVIIFAILFFISYGLYVFVEQPSIRFGQKLSGLGNRK